MNCKKNFIITMANYLIWTELLSINIYTIIDFDEWFEFERIEVKMIRIGMQTEETGSLRRRKRTPDRHVPSRK